MHTHNEPKVIDTMQEDMTIDKQAIKTIQDVNSHRLSVQRKIYFLISKLEERAFAHDLSKLQSPEISWLIEMDKEPRYKYGSDEYFEKMKRWQKFFDHHYKMNRHHPDHFWNGVNGMSLVDLIEYLCDIISYFDELHVQEAIDTIDKQKDRFRLSEQLADVLKNTLLEYFTMLGSIKSPYNEKHS